MTPTETGPSQGRPDGRPFFFGLRTEFLAGITTFLSMAYILVVQPGVLSGLAMGEPTGMDPRAIFAATCIAAAVGCLVMAVVARLPIAVAPGMGQNVFFVGIAATAAASGAPSGWSTALGCVFVAGALLVLVSATGLRQAVVEAVDEGMREAICAGIGLFIALLGLKQAGIIAPHPATGLGLGSSIASVDTLVFMLALVIGAAMHARGKRTAIAISVLAGLAGGVAVGKIGLSAGVFAAPPSPAPLLLGLDIPGALAPAMLVPTLALFLSLLFDATGSILAVTSGTGLVEGPRSGAFRRALLGDSIASCTGALAGSSSLTAYIESATGVAAGGRTGIVALVVGACFLAALFLGPLADALGGYPPATAAALVMVGCLMVGATARVPWGDPCIGIPAFLTLVGIPFTGSITAGIAIGLAASPIIKALAGRWREVHAIAWVLCVVMAAYLAYEGR